MFNSSVIDVAIGLVFVFLLLSLVASAAKEGLEAMFKRRATELERGIKELIGNDGDKFVAALYDHGLINSLFAGKYGEKKTELPSYIPSKNFALALMELRKQSQIAESKVVLPSHVKQAFDAFNITAEEDVDKMQKQIEDWYNSSMDRVSGWYKRRTQWWLLGIGLLITIAVNVDSIVIAKRLSTDKTLREAVVKAAQQEVKSNDVKNEVKNTTDVHPPDKSAIPDKSVAPDKNLTPEKNAITDKNGAATDDKTATAGPTVEQSIGKIKTNLSSLDGIGLPLGWGTDLDQWHKDKEEAEKATKKAISDNKPDTPIPSPGYGLFFRMIRHLPGWLITALAVSLGAPFWFDMLNKFMVVRSTVKPHEKSKEEGSKDPGTPKKDTLPTQQAVV